MTDEVDVGIFNEKVDIWSIGVIAYILLVGNFPFNGEDKEEIIENIVDAQIDWGTPEVGHVSPNARAFINKCLKRRA